MSETQEQVQGQGEAQAAAGGSQQPADDAAAKLAALRPKLDALYKERNDLIKRFDGIDPERAREALKLAEERERADAEKKGDFERLRAKLVEEHAKQVEQERSTAAKLRAALEGQLVRAEAIRAIAAAKGDPELLLPHVLAAVEVVEVDGEFVARVRDQKEKGKHRLNSKAEFMSIAELVAEEFKSKFPRAFEGTGTAGSGAVGSAGVAGSSGNIVLTREQARDHATYLRAKEDAAKRGVAVQIAGN